VLRAEEEPPLPSLTSCCERVQRDIVRGHSRLESFVRRSNPGPCLLCTYDAGAAGEQLPPKGLPPFKLLLVDTPRVAAGYFA
jgi:hypothetical protein